VKTIAKYFWIMISEIDRHVSSWILAHLTTTYHAQVKKIQLSSPQVKPNSPSFPAVVESFVAPPDADWLFAIVLFVPFVLFVPVVPLLAALPVRLPKAPSPPSTALGVDVLEVWTVFVVVELLLAETDLAVEADEVLWEMPPVYGWPVAELRYQFSGGSFMHSP
jgi:hypothetical protein